MPEEWLEKLKDDLSKRLHGMAPDQVVLVGVGNRLRGDDGIGPALIDLLKEKMPNAIDAGYAPENYTSAVKRFEPAMIVFIDAVKFDDWPAGYARILEIDDVEKRRISVHNFSLDVIMGYLKEETGAEVFMIGVQPKRVADVESLSPEIDKPLHEIAKAIERALSH